MSLRCYHQKILHLDLSSLKQWVESPPDEFYRKYGGGSAMGMYYILKETPPHISPFSPQNLLTIFLGVPTGLPIAGQSRVTINAKSPLSDCIGDSQAGGYFPARMKFAGFDGIVIRGKASNPVYLWINNGKVEIRDATHLWGKTTDETEDLIKNELDDSKVEILQIGPAGENLVRFAAVINMCNRANGRTGMGSVMGSKNLKAIVVQGDKKVKAINPKQFLSLAKEGALRSKNSLIQIHGTARTVALANMAGGLPTYNFNEGQFEHYDSIDGTTITETILKQRDTCYACPVLCKRRIETEYQGYKVLPRFGGPEYETIATFGSYCYVSDLNAICMANQLCDMYGMDTVTCGATIAFAMECFENNLITLKDTGGIDLHWGNAESMVKMVELTGQKVGFGAVLSEGSARAAKIIGNHADQYLITFKGTEPPGHMPQQKKSLGLIYAVNSFGADHMSAEHDPFYEIGTASVDHLSNMAELGLINPQPIGSINDEKARFVYITQKYFSALDSFNLCVFVWGPGPRFFSPLETVDMVNAATGWGLSIEEFLEIGERRMNMMRMFNAREGMTRDDDSLPSKFFHPLKGTGPTAGVYWTISQIESLKNSYYNLCGWDATTGNPTTDKLEALGLEWV